MDSCDREVPKSPFPNVFHILPQGHDKALKKAFYNIAAILFVIFSSATAVAIYHILQPFLRPLLWAALCGTFLYPFKYRVTTGARRWLRGLQVTKTPLFLGFIFLPVVILYNLVDYLGRLCWNNIKIIAFCCFSVLSIFFFLTMWPIQGIITGTTKFVMYAETVLSFFSSSWIWSPVIGYLLVVAFCYNERTKIFLTLGSFFLWIAICFHLVNVFNGPFVLGLCTFSSVLGVIGLVHNLSKIRSRSSADHKKNDNIIVVDRNDGQVDSSKETTNPSTTNQHQAVYSIIDDDDDDDDNGSGGGRVTNVTDDASRNFTATNITDHDKNDGNDENEDGGSGVRVRGVNVLPHHHHDKDKDSPDSVKQQLFLPLSDYESAVAGEAGGGGCGSGDNGSKKTFSDYCLMVLLWCTVLVQLWLYNILFIIIPLLLLCFIVKVLDNYLEVWSLLTGWFSSNLDLLKQNLSNGSRLGVIIPWPLICMLDKSIDKICSAFIVVLLVLGVGLLAVLAALEVHKESMHLVQISSNVFNKSEHPEFTRWLPDDEVLQNTLDSMVKNAYVYGREWIVRQNKTMKAYEKQLSLGDFSIINASFPFAYYRMKKLDLNLIDIARENVDLFMSVCFRLHVIFLTTLFYLLSSSHCQYKPVEFFCSFSPSYMNNFAFAKAFQDAINSVFLVSCKMAVFYGLYTWLTHSILGIQIVFIPSILAASFAAVPFLGTYVACLPAVFELWLVNGQPIHALVLFAAHYLPTLFIDTAFYSEIKGGHPYLTGLAILGGIYWMGLEGAIVGPVLLCCFVVAVHMYQAMIQPDSD
ncbi:hypothetical protein HELRODRAFT_193018 [Helobdella robusta]|uniref:Transmembrane protein 245 n=1 Tax=Helobdella robusta TaxID=6412 RepID=T1FUI9_HELRO|nr:hypothetical protein HELRODRAFT_193018 [Helobdella robusta]ESN98255.1 hypothetical protein HELRODRAFT_193018 [Helobdella robusta]